MAKRAAEKYLTDRNVDEQEPDEQPEEGFVAAPANELSRRPIRGLPNRSSKPKSSSAPIPVSSPEPSSNPFAALSPGATATSDNSPMTKYYASLRGLNLSVVSAIQRVVDKDPFADLSVPLSDLHARYKEEWMKAKLHKDHRPRSAAPKSSSLPSSTGVESSTAQPMAPPVVSPFATTSSSTSSSSAAPAHSTSPSTSIFANAFAAPSNVDISTTESSTSTAPTSSTTTKPSSIPSASKTSAEPPKSNPFASLSFNIPTKPSPLRESSTPPTLDEASTRPPESSSFTFVVTTQSESPGLTMTAKPFPPTTPLTTHSSSSGSTFSFSKPAETETSESDPTAISFLKPTAKENNVAAPATSSSSSAEKAFSFVRAQVTEPENKDAHTPTTSLFATSSATSASPTSLSFGNTSQPTSASASPFSGLSFGSTPSSAISVPESDHKTAEPPKNSSVGEESDSTGTVSTPPKPPINFMGFGSASKSNQSRNVSPSSVGFSFGFGGTSSSTPSTTGSSSSFTFTPTTTTATTSSIATAPTPSTEPSFKFGSNTTNKSTGFGSSFGSAFGNGILAASGAPTASSTPFPFDSMNKDKQPTNTSSSESVKQFSFTAPNKENGEERAKSPSPFAGIGATGSRESSLPAPSSLPTSANSTDTEGGDNDDATSSLIDKGGEGEANEETLSKVRCKVFRQDGEGNWIDDKGVCILQLKKNKETGGLRFLGRKEANANVNINFALSESFKFQVNKSTASFLGFDDQEATLFRIRVKNEEIMLPFKEAVEKTVGNLG